MVGNMRAKNGPGFMAAAYVAANLDRFWGLGVIILSELSFVFLGHRKFFFGPQTHCWMLGSSIFYVLRDTKEAFLFIYLFFNLRFDIRFMKKTCHFCPDYGGNYPQRAPITTPPYPMVRGVVFFLRTIIIMIILSGEF